MQDINQDELQKMWRAVLTGVELQVPKASFVTWLKHSELIDKKDGVAYVALPNNFTKAWVENKYNKILLGNVRLIDDSTKNIKFIVKNTKPKEIKEVYEYAKEEMAALGNANEKQLAFAEFKIDPNTNLNPKYTLSSFIVGSSNELAYAATQGVMSDVGKKYNPLFIYGGVGLGKTHLMQGAGNEIKKMYNDQIHVKYVSSEKFTSDIISGIKAKRMEDVKKKYRDIDVLIIDDIQFIAGKEKTELEFFNTFNALYEVNKQIIISSDRPPKAIPVLEERLRSRFEGGMVVDIVPPDYETRVAIIKTKLQQKNKELPDPVIEVIASKIRKNIRELEGIVNIILFYKEQKKFDITPQFANDIIRKNTQHTPENITPQQIIQSVANFFQILIEDLMGTCRKKEFVRPRQVAIYLLRDMLELSYPYIGELVGKKDHTTAIHAFEKINRELNKNSDLNQKIILIKDIINKSSE